MASFATLRPSEAPKPRWKRLYGNRWRLLHYERISHDSQLTPGRVEPWDTEFRGIATTGANTAAWADLRLIETDIIGAERGQRSETGTYIERIYETLTNTFVDEVAPATDYELNGLKRVTRQLIARPGTSTAAYVVGTQAYGSGLTLYLAKLSIETSDAYTRIRAEYLQPGVVSRSIRQLDDGLREETIRAFYTKTSPAAGILVREEQENELGYPVWAVSALQNASGGDPTTGTAHSYTSLDRFTYPGRAKLFTRTKTFGVVTFHFLDCYLDAPIEAQVAATTEITYSASADAPTLAHTLWNPTQWAVLDAIYAIENNTNGTRSKVEALRGYRAAAGSQTVDFASAINNPAVAFGTLILVDNAYGGTAKLYGGPPDPGGATWTLKYSVQPAFVSVAGTKYYRHAVTYAPIPAQDALPV